MTKLTAFLVALLSTTSVVATTPSPSPKKTVLISQIVEHPALTSTVKGILDGLEKKGFKQGENLDVRVESAQNSPALASQIAVKFMSQNPDVVVGVGTISAQSLAKYAHENKVTLIFSSVTDPLESSLVKNLNHPGNNTSGVSNFIELEPQLQLFQKIQPQLQRLGILYNPGESNSVSIVKKLEILCPSLGITLIKQTIPKTADVAQAAVKLAHQVDAIFISNDSMALSALQSILQAANRAKIPVYLSDTDAVALGAVAALGPNQYDVGVQTGEMIARALNGQDVGKMPVEFPKKTDLYVNDVAAQRLGIMIPESVRQLRKKSS